MGKKQSCKCQHYFLDKHTWVQCEENQSFLWNTGCKYTSIRNYGEYKRSEGFVRSTLENLLGIKGRLSSVRWWLATWDVLHAKQESWKPKWYVFCESTIHKFVDCNHVADVPSPKKILSKSLRLLSRKGGSYMLRLPRKINDSSSSLNEYGLPLQNFTWDFHVRNRLKPGRLYRGRWNALMSRWSMCDAEKDWHERAFRQKLTRSVIFPAVVFSLFFH